MVRMNPRDKTWPLSLRHLDIRGVRGLDETGGVVSNGRMNKLAAEMKPE
jgi:hypothetical protein